MLKWLSILCIIVLVAMTVSAADACTSVRIKTDDGYVLYARTMEFALPMKSIVSVIPKGTKFQGTLPDGTSKGIVWNAKYGVVGMNAAGMPIIVDGMNEKGLAAGALLFPGFAGYEPSDPAKANTTMAQYEVITWILSNFATVDEVREGIKGIRVCEASAPEFGPIPLHYVVHDAKGDCIVIEHVKGKMNLYDNPLGVLTNSPPFNWMMIDLRNFVNLTAVNVPELKLQGTTLEQLGQGTGMLGLPGDFTPPHRLVRILALSQSAYPVHGPDAGLSLIMTIIDNVDIPKGAVRGKGDKGADDDFTQWVTAADLGRKRFYFHTLENKNWHYVDMMKVLEGAKGVLSVPIDIPVDYPDVSSTAH